MRSTFTRAALVLAGAALLSACGTIQRHKELTAENRTRLKEVRIQLVVPQETFIFSATGAGVAAVGGLIPALIDASIQKSRQESMRGDMEAMADKLIDVDFRAEAQLGLDEAAPQLPMRVVSAKVDAAMPTKKAGDAMVAATKGQPAYLRLLLQYSMDPRTLWLTTRTHASLWQEGAAEPTFAGSAVYQGRLEASPMPASASQWTPQVMEALRREMRQSIRQTVKMVALDLTGQAAAKDALKKPYPFMSPGQAGPLQVQAVALAEDATRVLVRDTGGVMFSLQK